MAKAIHLKNVRDSGNLRGLSPVQGQANTFRSIAWEILAADADELVGGWVYLHPAKTSNSEFGGKVLRVEALDTLSAHGNPEIAIVFESRREGRGQRWRGADYQMAWRSGLVDLELPHEIVDNASRS